MAEPGLHLVVVGRTEGALPVTLAPLTRSSHQAKGGPPPVLLAGGVSQLSGLPVFSAVYRAYGWTTPIDPRSLHDWEITGLLDREATAAQHVRRLGTPFGLTGPTNTLVALREADAVAARRMQLVGGGAAALLLGFVLLAAAGLRRDAGTEWARLERHGARLGQLWTFAWVEAAWITLAGAIFGAVVAATQNNPIIAIVGFAVSFILWIAIALISSTMKVIVTTALYQYAATGSAPGSFDGELLRSAFRPKKQKN